MKVKNLVCTTRPDRHKMNKTEAEFANLLEMRKLAKEIRLWEWEPIKLRLGSDHKTTYTPDFMSVGQGGEVTFWEVKGFWRDDAKVKIKVAADKYYYWNFVSVQKKKGEWSYETH